MCTTNYQSKENVRKQHTCLGVIQDSFLILNRFFKSQASNFFCLWDILIF